jgi:hypothetical protein
VSDGFGAIRICHGPDQIVARPAVVVHCAWLRESDRGAALEWFRRQVPATKLVRLGSRTMVAFGNKAWPGAVASARDGKFLRIGDEPGFVAGECAIEIESETCAIALPYAWASERADELARAFDELVDAVRPAHAACAIGFNLVWGREWEQVALPPMLQIALAHPAIDLHARESVSGGSLKSAAWLVHVGRHLVERLAPGAPHGCERRAFADGVTFRTGARPVLGTNADELAPLRALDAHVRPIRSTYWGAHGSLFRFRSPHAHVRGFPYTPAEVDPDSWFARLA